MTVQITFLGGAGTVTGSKFLVQHEGHSLLVDCGLFQGYKQLRLRNRQPLPVMPNHIGAVILTHAHLDHSGYLPLLVKEGFQGNVWASAGTRDLCEILLPDSGHIQEEDAAYANRKGFSKHALALPLYTEEDARISLKQIRTAPMREVFEPLHGWHGRFISAGHILGACSLLLEVGGRRLLFSGDVGRPDDLIMLAPESPADIGEHGRVDAVVLESTYGDRSHPPDELIEELASALERVAARGGAAVVPVFAVGRAQALLHAIGLLKSQGRIPRSLPVYLDSPMAIHSTELLAHHLGEHRLSAGECRDMARVATMTRTPDESKAIAQQHGPKIVLSASGMATGGRVLHHLMQYLSDHQNMVVLTGYQAPGTRGATLAQLANAAAAQNTGGSPGRHMGNATLRIHGQDVPVRAEVVQLHSASAHADGSQLMDWLRQLPLPPRQVFVVHGDQEASDTLRQRIEHELKWPAMVPEHGATWPV